MPNCPKPDSNQQELNSTIKLCWDARVMISSPSATTTPTTTTTTTF